MPQYNEDVSARSFIADNIGGMRVDTVAALPATGTVSLFTITGGRVLLVNFLGEATFLNNGSLTCKISALTTDATAVLTDLTNATVNFNTDTAGTIYTLLATVGTIVKSTNNSAAVANTMVPWVIKTGSLNAIYVGTPSTGLVKWSAWYVPLDDGAYMYAT